MLSTTGLQTIFIWPEHRCSLFVFLLLFWHWQHSLLDGLKVKNRIHYHPILFCYPHIVIVFLQKTSWCCLWHFLFDLFCSDKSFVGASVGYFLFLFLLAGRALTVSYIDLTSFKLWIFMFVFNFVLFLVVLAYLHLHYSNLFSAGSSFTSNCCLFSKSIACICLRFSCRLWKECQVCPSVLF